MAKEYNPQLAEMGTKIVARREELGMTATELSIYADISTVTLSSAESGHSAIGTDKLIRIADVLKVPLSYLQPGKLEKYSEIPSELIPLLPKLKKKSPEEQRKLIQMFASMIDIM
ncbi:MAG: helix-turn-helix transcriptional regulator [Ruminiclostridium sp.]|uniref:helix-turn-helix domain-containing protein n=1 Tax=Ruminococcus sp. TaxID=41978 RepID=UPI0025DD2647|nr:helix-turn-helix transcriptional regulator [Ruminococcus sp.]MBR1433304.1 helix-turn-helix transcriptional regulator [Ruminococcus sp.]MBR1831437.1 helix-turn-helix transcriptional regulator [Ruminiclostridium sp.]